MLSEIGEKLRRLRVEANYSQEFVSDRIGIHVSTYSRWEREDGPIDFRAIVKLAELYKVSLDELYNYGDPSYSKSQAKLAYLKKWSVAVTVSLDGTDDTLQEWVKKLTAINAAL